MNLIFSKLKSHPFITLLVTSSFSLLISMLLSLTLSWEHNESWYFLYSCLDKYEAYDSSFPLTFFLETLIQEQGRRLDLELLSKKLESH